MKRSIYMLAALMAATTASGETHYVTSFTGTSFSLIFPAPDIPKNSPVYKDVWWAIDVVDVMCDGKTLSGVEVQPAGVQPMPLGNSGNGILVYCAPISDFVFWDGKRDAEKDPVLVEYRIPVFSNKIVIRYRVRLPNSGVSNKIYTVTSYLRPYFPSGSRDEE